MKPGRTAEHPLTPDGGWQPIELVRLISFLSESTAVEDGAVVAGLELRDMRDLVVGRAPLRAR